MKTVFSTFLFLILMNNGFSFPKKSKIPSQVNAYINNHFPRAQKVHWMIHEGNFIVSLYHNESHIELCLSEKGNYMNSIHEIGYYEEIPGKIQKQLDLKKVAYAEKLQSNQGELFYIIEVGLPKGKIEEVVFDGNGVNISKHITTDNNKKVDLDILHF